MTCKNTYAQNHQDSLQQELLKAIQTAPILEKLEPKTDNVFVSTDLTFPFASANSLILELPTVNNQKPLTFAPEAITLESSRANNIAHPSCPFVLKANQKIIVNFTQANTFT